MEGYPYSTYPESGDSSPQCREIDGETAISWDETPPPAASRVKLMCSYGGRIQPRPHDNQLSYFSGETKILAVDRSIRFQAIISKLSSLYGANSPDDICFKYQLPGEDLDALISVTNDEDLDHMMIEYDRLHLSSGKPAARLRLFLFPANPSVGSGKAEQKPDRMWFLEPLLPPSMDLNLNPLQPPPPPPPAALIPDFLSGIAPPPVTLKAKDATPENLVAEALANDAISARSDPAKEETPKSAGETAVSLSDEVVQRQIQEIQRLQIGESQIHPPAKMQRNGSEEALARVYHGEYYAGRVHDKGLPAPAVALSPATAAGTQIPAAYWADQRGIAGGRFASVAGGDQPVYFIPTSHTLYPPTTGQAYYAAAHPPPQPPAFSRVMPADVYRDVPAMYAVAPPQGMEGAPANTPAAGYAAAQVGYDSMGRAVIYPGAVATYQAVSNVALNTEPKMTKPSQIS